LRPVDDEARPSEGVEQGRTVRPCGHRAEACHHPVRAGSLDDLSGPPPPSGIGPWADEFLRETREEGLRPPGANLLDRFVPPATGGLTVGSRPGGDEAEARDRIRASPREGQRDVSSEAVARDREPL